STDSAYYWRAIKNLREAALPGQISSGNWMDGHNAESVYHAVMLYNMAPVLASMSPTHPLHDTLAQMLTLATRRFIVYEETCGASVGYKSLLRLWVLDTHCIAQPLHDSITNLIGRYINQSSMNGRFLDVPTMGLYLELLQQLNAVEQNPANGIKASLFPNPATSFITLKYQTARAENISVKIFSTTGVLVSEQQIAASSSEQQLELDVRELAAGFYVLRLESSTQVQSLSFILNND
ncbi:MAG: T9SS type A sorting domain-containing protein, partial [Bacteroidia bacterium]